MDAGTVSPTNPNIRLRGTTDAVPDNSKGNDGDILLFDDGLDQALYIKMNGKWVYFLKSGEVGQ